MSEPTGNGQVVHRVLAWVAGVLVTIILAGGGWWMTYVSTRVESANLKIAAIEVRYEAMKQQLDRIESLVRELSVRHDPRPR